jgi:hypothetical protein
MNDYFYVKKARPLYPAQFLQYLLLFGGLFHALSITFKAIFEPQFLMHFTHLWLLAMAVLQQNASRANSAIHAAIGNIKVTTSLKI